MYKRMYVPTFLFYHICEEEEIVKRNIRSIFLDK
jgi:hypothetical protein